MGTHRHLLLLYLVLKLWNSVLCSSSHSILPDGRRIVCKCRLCFSSTRNYTSVCTTLALLSSPILEKTIQDGRSLFVNVVCSCISSTVWKWISVIHFSAHIFYHQKFFKTAKGYLYVNVGCASFILNCAEILKQSIGARNRVGIELSFLYPHRWFLKFQHSPVKIAASYSWKCHLCFSCVIL